MLDRLKQRGTSCVAQRYRYRYRDMCLCTPYSLFLYRSTVTHKAVGELQSEHGVQLLLEDLLKKLPNLRNEVIFIQRLLTAIIRPLAARAPFCCTQRQEGTSHELQCCACRLYTCASVAASLSWGDCHQTLRKSLYLICDKMMLIITPDTFHI